MSKGPLTPEVPRKMVIRDLQAQFVNEMVFRAVQCNAIYEDRYLLGTSLARPIVAREQVRVAQEYKCDILSHGCTGKGNDQVRFELAWQAVPLRHPLAKGIPVKVTIENGEEVTEPVELFKLLNRIGHDAGVGRVDIVENRFIGLKSRGCYDTPGLTILRLAHIDLEGLVMDSAVRALRDQFITISWSRQLYNGMYFSPEREFVENSIIFSQQNVNGVVRIMAYKGNAYALGRGSETSNLYSEEDASMDSHSTFSPMDTTWFIAIQAIRLKKYGESKISQGTLRTES
ncbi:hypothetical protein DL767_008804 [Monosporascus sp. MG133]|nr:hypothetical protein DL767_008804 [Monosporascus sp. MG133]